MKWFLATKLEDRFRDAQPLVNKYNLNVSGYWVAAESDTFVYIVAHDSLDEAKKTWKAIHSDLLLWIATWTASPQSLTLDPNEPLLKIENQTVRERVRVSIGGERVWIRFTNELSSDPLVIGSATVNAHAITFAGQTAVMIPPGAPMVSDPIDLHVAALLSEARGESDAALVRVEARGDRPCDHDRIVDRNQRNLCRDETPATADRRVRRLAHRRRRRERTARASASARWRASIATRCRSPASPTSCWRKG